MSTLILSEPKEITYFFENVASNSFIQFREKFRKEATPVIFEYESKFCKSYGFDLLETSEKLFNVLSASLRLKYDDILRMAAGLHGARSVENFFNLSDTNQMRVVKIINPLVKNTGYLHSIIVLLDFCNAELPEFDVASWYIYDDDRAYKPVVIETKNHGAITYTLNSSLPRDYYMDFLPRMDNDGMWPLLETAMSLLMYGFGRDKVLEVIDHYRSQQKRFNLFTLVQLLKIWDEKSEELKQYPLEWVNQTFLEESCFAVSWDYKPRIVLL